MEHWGALAIGSVLLFQGCSQNSQPHYETLNLVDISGTVRLEGKELTNIEVRFVDMEEGIYSFGATDEKGNYKLMLDSRKSGIIPGKKRVQFVSKPKGESEMSQEDADAESKTMKRSAAGNIPACYGKDSKIEVEVKGSETHFDFDLKLDCTTLNRSN